MKSFMKLQFENMLYNVAKESWCFTRRFDGDDTTGSPLQTEISISGADVTQKRKWSKNVIHSAHSTINRQKPVSAELTPPTGLNGQKSVSAELTPPTGLKGQKPVSAELTPPTGLKGQKPVSAELTPEMLSLMIMHMKFSAWLMVDAFSSCFLGMYRRG
jgi:hypothetical protein